MTLSTVSEEPPEGRCWDPLGHRWVTPRFLYWYSRPPHSHLSGILHAPTAGIEPATCGLGMALGAGNDGTGRRPTGCFRRSIAMWWRGTEQDETG